MLSQLLIDKDAVAKYKNGEKVIFRSAVDESILEGIIYDSKFTIALQTWIYQIEVSELLFVLRVEKDISKKVE